MRRPVIDMPTLEIIAFYCETSRQKRQLVLMSRDIRQLASDCIIIDNEEELTDPEDIIRLKDTLETAYNPIDKPVVSENGHRLGSIEDYTVNLETNRLQKLHVRQSILRAWLGSNLVIDRTQIIDVTPHRIVVREPTVKLPALQPEPVPEINP